jgi:hypothetical protein
MAAKKAKARFAEPMLLLRPQAHYRTMTAGYERLSSTVIEPLPSRTREILSPLMQCPMAGAVSVKPKNIANATAKIRRVRSRKYTVKWANTSE